MQNKTGLAVSIMQMHYKVYYKVLLAALLAASSLAEAADFKGATEVLREAAQATPKPKEAEKDSHGPFRERLKSFAVQSTNLPPSQAATQWLAFTEEFEKEFGRDIASPRLRSRVEKGIQFDEVMNALPPPAAWEELAKAVEARPAVAAKGKEKRELGLKLIAHTLTRNTSKRAEDLKALDALAKGSSGPEGGFELESIFQILNE